jgi:hypothetical protein
MTKLERKEIAQEWVKFANHNVYHLQFPEHQNYAPITDEQWDTFGFVMSYLSEDWEYQTPTGTEERQWYRAYAEILTGGREYCKEICNKIIDGKSEYWSNDYHILQMIPFLDKILK